MNRTLLRFAGTALALMLLIGTVAYGQGPGRGGRLARLHGLYAGAGSGYSNANSPDGVLPQSAMVVLKANGAGEGTLEITQASVGTLVLPMTYTVTSRGAVTVAYNSGNSGFGALQGQIVGNGTRIAFTALVIGTTGYDIAGMLEAE